VFIAFCYAPPTGKFAGYAYARGTAADDTRPRDLIDAAGRYRPLPIALATTWLLEKYGVLLE
jgi:hypothetical protein